MSAWEIREGDALSVLRTLPAESVQTCVTSPPYFGLRDYGVSGQIGLEASPEEFVAALVGVFAEVRRVLRKDGTLWLNLGDSYAGSPPGNARPDHSGNDRTGTRGEQGSATSSLCGAPSSLPHKNLLGIPWRVAFALQADGWYLRSEIIWAKPNPMPESVTDRPTKAHEQIFLFSRSPRYFYDADAVREAWADDRQGASGARNLPYSEGSGRRDTLGSSSRQGLGVAPITPGRNLRSVWQIATTPYPGAHFATFPPELPERCIKAGTSERGACPQCGAAWKRVVERGKAHKVRWAPGKGQKVDTAQGRHGETSALYTGVVYDRVTAGFSPSCHCPAAEPVPCVVLDPFAGAGTTLLVARRLGRRALGIELNPTYAALARERITADMPLLNAGGSL